MTFPLRRKIEFYSSKTKSELLDEVNKMISDKKYETADLETFMGTFVIRTVKRFLLFNIVFCGDIYEIEGKTLVIITAKMRLFVEVLLLTGIGTAATGFLDLFIDLGSNVYEFVTGLLFLCGLFWGVNYIQFKPGLNSLKSNLS